ncbi:hypothetical protein LZ31DRAFT_282320 [Colletotrichum somersetense]|nr:hypothetical protein LZ31DRAFT_282320 [Colletotrichum somersetense]
MYRGTYRTLALPPGMSCLFLLWWPSPASQSIMTKSPFLQGGIWFTKRNQIMLDRVNALNPAGLQKSLHCSSCLDQTVWWICQKRRLPTHCNQCKLAATARCRAFLKTMNENVCLLTLRSSS